MTVALPPAAAAPPVLAGPAVPQAPIGTVAPVPALETLAAVARPPAPQAPPTSIGAPFDGSRVSRPEAPSLEGLAAAWNTQSQLSRLTPRPPEQSFRFAVIGDAEPGRFWVNRRLFGRPGVFWRQLAAAEARDGDFIVQLGDMVSRGTRLAFRRLLSGLSALGLSKPYITVIGNHDRAKPHGRADSAVYRSVFGKTDYHFDHAGVRFVVVDSSSKGLTGAQLFWLDRVLRAPGRKIVFTHIPPAALWAWPGLGPVVALGGFTRGAREFVELLAKRGVSRVYSGHIHALGAYDHRGVRFVLTGGGGSPLYPLPVRRELFHHTLTVEVGPDGVKDTVHPLDGESFPLEPSR